MSLLIPTENDYADAYGAPEQYKVYQNKILEIEHELDWEFEVVPGFFKQADENIDDLQFNYATEKLGRLKDWDEIISELDVLNKNCEDNVSYKLVFFARHGEGFHNVGVKKYGIQQWRSYWNKMTTDGDIVWAPDPKLSELGEKQALENNIVWKKEVELGAPIPSKFYVSPLQRSMRTHYLTWHDIVPKGTRFLVKELLRETIGANLCHKRSPKSYIDNVFAPIGFDTAEITETDDLFTDKKESFWEQTIRMNKFLQYLFDQDCIGGKIERNIVKRNTFISTTSHAGSIRAFITVLGHRNFTIPTGGMIPIVIKAKRKCP